MVTEFGRMLRIIRVNHNDSLRTMARKLGYSPAHLSSMETGKRTIPIDIAERIKTCYDLSDSDTEKLMQSILLPASRKNENLTDFAEQKDREAALLGISAFLENEAQKGETCMNYAVGGETIRDFLNKK